MDKKGQGGTNWLIISIILLIAGFVVVIYFYSRTDFESISNEKICYASVVTRSELLSLGGELTAPPLNCKTSYYCISGDGTCEIMSASTKIIKVKTAEEVYEAVADKMVSCWDMYGSGKLDYLGEKDNSENLYCSFCYQIGFDNSLDMFLGDVFSRNDFYNYLYNTNVSETKISYLEYFIGSAERSKDFYDSLVQGNIHLSDLPLEKQYFIMTGIYSKVGFLGSITFTLPGVAISPEMAKEAVEKWDYFFNQGTTHHFLVPLLVSPNSEEYKNLKCVSIETIA
jgi:hypothetical protein